MTTIIKTRKLEILEMTSEEIKKDMFSCLNGMPGVITVEILSGTKIRIKYDLMRVRFSQIAKRLSQNGFASTQAMIPRIRRGWIAFTEQNEFDSMNAPVSPCCSNPKLDRKPYNSRSGFDHNSPGDS